MKSHKLAIFASGNGTNAEKIMEYFKNHSSIQVGAIVSNNANALVLHRAEKYDVESVLVSKSDLQDGTLANGLAARGITHIALAGFLLLMPQNLVQKFHGRIINLHPALLPKFGGKGMYGLRVHEAVKAAGDAATGITIHEVNEHYDEGRILFQTKCAVTADDSAEAIAKKVHQLEYRHYPRVIEQWILQQPITG